MATVAITPDHDTIEAEIFVAAPPERVFQALTDPGQMPRWWGQAGMYRITECKADLRPGGKWSSVGVEQTEPPLASTVNTSRSIRCASSSIPDGHLSQRAHRGAMGTEPARCNNFRHGVPRKRYRMPSNSAIRTAGDEKAEGSRRGLERVLAWMQVSVETGATVETGK
jgi:hypothetical protein